MAKRQQTTKAAGREVIGRLELYRKREKEVLEAAREYVRVADAGRHDGLGGYYEGLAGISIEQAYKNLSAALTTLDRLDFEHDSK